MSLGIYDGLVDFLLQLIKQVFYFDIQDSLRSTLIDTLDMTTILLIVIISAILLIWVERKSVGRIMNRRGPVFIDLNWGHFFGRTWKFGLMQNIAEFLKFFSKEDIVPDKADKFGFNLGFFAFIVAPPFMVIGIIPLGSNSFISNPAVGFLLIFALFALYPVGVLITGWSSNNKYSLIGSFRSAAQVISYEIPLVLSIISVVMVVGSFSLLDIINAQANGFQFMFLMPIGFIVYMVSLAAESERIPFDLPEAESEIVMGWRTEVTGFRYMMSMATEYFHLLINAFIAVAIFWGGWNLPFIQIDIPILQAIIYIAKVWFFMWIFFLVRGALPRVRIDQLLNIGWKRLIPLALFNILLVILISYNYPSLFGIGG